MYGPRLAHVQTQRRLPRSEAAGQGTRNLGGTLHAGRNTRGQGCHGAWCACFQAGCASYGDSICSPSFRRPQTAHAVLTTDGYRHLCDPRHTWAGISMLTPRKEETALQNGGTERLGILKTKVPQVQGPKNGKNPGCPIPSGPPDPSASGLWREHQGEARRSCPSPPEGTPDCKSEHMGTRFPTR